MQVIMIVLYENLETYVNEKQQQRINPLYYKKPYSITN